ncbi:MAG: type I restriction endonuclease subunit R [Rhodobacteraceae bacterium]|nr:type I restriction endonuclease subunit R [Paracoccaceae bacterium]MCY4250292.1 type I restriction endonuclease subunit R [Paracoccaceae bacterium]
MSQVIFTEDIVEQAALAWFESLGYKLLHGPDIAPGGSIQLRTSYSEIILEEKLRSALTEINPHIPSDVIEEVYRKVSTSASPDLYEDNQIFHEMLVNGVAVEFTKPDGKITGDIVWLIDFKNPTHNNFYAIKQFTVVENQQNRRPDIVVCANGIPLAIVELKNAVNENTTNHHAYNQLQTYKKEIPSLFRTNAVLVISDGIEARVGSLTASKERFMPWRTIDGINIEPKGSAELETLLKGLFEKSVLLDLIQNFTVFEVDGTQIIKKVAAYHQYHAVNKAVECTVSASSEKGDKRSGVIWHTQGSGKSLSMAFFAGKIIQQEPMKNPTLVVITDRNDLDDQLFGTFCLCEKLLHQTPVQAKDRKHLSELLHVASGGVVFTTIQKFAPEKGEAYPHLSDRRNIVVIADEAHRSQYDFIDGFARHMRDGLPNASFIGFSGTPIEFSNKDTYAVFGDNIHTYDIQQAVEDGATVKIYYESRLAKIELDESVKPHLEEDFQEVTEGEEVERKEKLKSKWARLEALVGAEKRISLIAQDLVDHFEHRLEAMDGKCMAVCMSRRICVDFYNAIIKLRPEWHNLDDDKGIIKVVMTGSASDPEIFQPHIRNKTGRDLLARRAKDPSDPLKLVIVRDMWLTGFDAPSMHTMYIDKPMQGHGLMQAIARVNRVFKDKPGGLVVDYLGIADNLKKALEKYTDRNRSVTGVPQGEAIAVMLEKYEIVKQLFYKFDYTSVIGGTLEERLRVIPAAMEHILSQEKGRDRFMQASLDLTKAFALCAAAEEAKEIRDDVGFFQNIRSALLKSTTVGGNDLEDLNTSLQQLISKAVASTDMVDIYSVAGLKNPDISILSDEFLAEFKGMIHKNLAMEMLRKLLMDQIKNCSEKNVVQAKNFTKMLETTIQKYQNRLIETAQVIEELINLAKVMRNTQNRSKELGLNDDEIAFYDALADNMSAQDVLGDDQLRTISCELAEAIKINTTIDWTVRQSVRAKIRVVVKRILRKYGYPPDKQEKATFTVLEQAELLSTA